MLYLVDITVTRPHGLGDDEWAALVQAESDYGMELRRDGRQLHIWRRAGAYAAVAVWSVDDHDELHTLITGLPLFPYLDVEVAPLVEHPTSVRWSRIQCGLEPHPG